MEAALAELSVEDVKDEADDKDFVIVKGKKYHPGLRPLEHSSTDEEDVFGSDFESTDEEAEAAHLAPDAGEGLVRAEERREQKVMYPFVFF
jgi:YL1 nuclear protein